MAEANNLCHCFYVVILQNFPNPVLKNSLQNFSFKIPKNKPENFSEAILQRGKIDTVLKSKHNYLRTKKFKPFMSLVQNMCKNCRSKI